MIFSTRFMICSTHFMSCSTQIISFWKNVWNNKRKTDLQLISQLIFWFAQSILWFAQLILWVAQFILWVAQFILWVAQLILWVAQHKRYIFERIYKIPWENHPLWLEISTHIKIMHFMHIDYWLNELLIWFNELLNLFYELLNSNYIFLKECVKEYVKK
jgi:hypothetical protein